MEQEPMRGNNPENIVIDFSEEQMNEAVAKKLGWILTEYGEMRISNHCGMWADHEWKRGKKVECEIPDYWHSIEAAWEIMEKERYALFSRMSKGQGNEKLDAWVCNADGRLYSAKTAPMAICLAFLKLKDINK